MIQPNVSLRQRLDVISGALLVLVILGGCLSLELTRRQRDQTRVLQVLAAQHARVEELTRIGEGLVAERLEQHPVNPDHLAAFRASIMQLSQTLYVLQYGGQIARGQGEPLHLRPVQGRLLIQNLQAAAMGLEQYDAFVTRMLEQEKLNPDSAETLRLEFVRSANELHTLIDGVIAETESQSWSHMVRAGFLQLLCMFVAGALFLVWIVVVRRLVTVPLRRIAERIHGMRQTGRLVKLPVVHDDELGYVAEGFNQLAEQVEHQKGKLREHIVELQRLNTEMEDLSKLKDDFLATISHQLRTPLMAVIESLDMMRDGTLGPLSDDQQTFVQTMYDNAKRLANLTEKALTLSLIQSGRRLLKPQAEDLTVLLRQSQASWQTVAGSRTIRLAGDALPPVYLDAAAIRSVMDQLLCNALRFAPDETEVVIEVRRTSTMAEVTVQDRGPGMSPEQLAKLFQPFVHIQTPDSPGSEGSGLGLAFCRQVIERHRGAIRAEAGQQGGTIVTFQLPLATLEVVFEHICRSMEEDAEHEQGQFGLLLVMPTISESEASVQMMAQAHTLLRRHTHRGDQFVWMNPHMFAIIAITDRAGLDAMLNRLSGIVVEAHLSVGIGDACFPSDGTSPEQLLAAAKRRFMERHAQIGQNRIEAHVAALGNGHS